MDCKGWRKPGEEARASRKLIGNDVPSHFGPEAEIKTNHRDLSVVLGR